MLLNIQVSVYFPYDVSGVPAVTKLESFHILFLPNIFVFLLSNSPSSAHLLEQMVPYNQNNHQAFPLP